MKHISEHDLKNFDQIILISKKINFDGIKKYLNFKKKILIFFINQNISDEFKTKINSYSNIVAQNYSWTLFYKVHFERWSFEKEAIHYIERNFEEITGKSKVSFFLLKKLYGSEKSLIPFKKEIVVEIKNILEHKKISEMISKSNENILNIVDDSIFKFLNSIDDIKKIKLLFKQKNTIFDSNTDFFLLKKKLYESFLFIIFPFYSILKIKKINLKKIKKKIGIRCYKNGIGFDDNEVNLNWIIDEKKINNQDALYIFETEPNQDHLKQIKVKGFDYILANKYNPLSNCSIFFLLKIIFFLIPLTFLISPLIFFSSYFVRKELVRAWILYFIWNNFINTFSIKNYLSYHDFGPQHIYRNIMLKKINCFTAMFKHTHSENVFDFEKIKNYAHCIYLYLFYDVEFHWSNLSVNMSKSNLSLSKEYVVSGPVWSSREFAKKNYVKQNNSKQKVIALFCSSLHGKNSTTSLIGHRDFLYFASDILNKYKNTKVILKTKNPIDLYKNIFETKEIILSLLKNSNFICPNINHPSYSIIRESDLVISTTFSSTTLESICMGVKSFYLDITGCFENSYFNKFENLVSHSREDGLKNIDYWFNINYQELQNKYINILSDLGMPNEADNALSIIRNKLVL